MPNGASFRPATISREVDPLTPRRSTLRQSTDANGRRPAPKVHRILTEQAALRQWLTVTGSISASGQGVALSLLDHKLTTYQICA